MLISSEPSASNSTIFSWGRPRARPKAAEAECPMAPPREMSLLLLVLMSAQCRPAVPTVDTIASPLWG